MRNWHLIRVYCAWCRKWVSTRVLHGIGNDITSHGICLPCSRKVKEGLRK